jgi:phage host-nuclease inhibitor protein Gam
VFEAIAFLWSWGIIQTTGERSSRRREWTTAIKRIGDETREASRKLAATNGSMEALTMSVTAGGVREIRA